MDDFRKGWNAFWFQPIAPHTLAIIRIGNGLMMAYMHCIWLFAFSDFLAEHAWIDLQSIRKLHQVDFKWSYLWYIESSGFIVAHQIVAIVVSLSLALGLVTRITAPLAWWLMLMICHRMTGTLFGLDQVVMMLGMYLMISDCGGAYSLDRLIANRRKLRNGEKSTWWLAGPKASTMNRIATRLLQLHLCVIYLFGGVSKLRGDMWWDGSALWFAVASYEYQSIDVTWIGRAPMLVAALTHLTLLWETFYCALIWPRLTRPWVLGMAVAVHGGIALFLGMITFGLIMIIANLAFIEPRTMHHTFQVVQRWTGRGSSSTEPRSDRARR